MQVKRPVDDDIVEHEPCSAGDEDARDKAFIHQILAEKFHLSLSSKSNCLAQS